MEDTEQPEAQTTLWFEVRPRKNQEKKWICTKSIAETKTAPEPVKIATRPANPESSRAPQLQAEEIGGVTKPQKLQIYTKNTECR